MNYSGHAADSGQALELHMGEFGELIPMSMSVWGGLQLVVNFNSGVLFQIWQ